MRGDILKEREVIRAWNKRNPSKKKSVLIVPKKPVRGIRDDDIRVKLYNEMVKIHKNLKISKQKQSDRYEEELDKVLNDKRRMEEIESGYNNENIRVNEV